MITDGLVTFIVNIAKAFALIKKKERNIKNFLSNKNKGLKSHDTVPLNAIRKKEDF